MIVAVDDTSQLDITLNGIGLERTLQSQRPALIKVDLQRPPHLRDYHTSPDLLRVLVKYILDRKTACTLVESADGDLADNLRAIGVGDLLELPGVTAIDLDEVEVDCLVVGGERHFLPRLLKDYSLRIGLPVASQLTGAFFSNNVNLLTGLVPRRYYQPGDPSVQDQHVARDLNNSIVNIYRGIMAYAPFQHFINGNMVHIEGQDQFDLGGIYVGDNAVELDQMILEKIGIGSACLPS